ncbi:hypothetical protein ZWY2020_024002, partial [Hordeum vulgare]
ASTIVSGSTDNSLNFWDLSMNQARVIDNPIQGFTWHTNTKIFLCTVSPDTYSMMNLKREEKWRRTPSRDIHIIMNDGQLISYGIAGGGEKTLLYSIRF